MAFNGTGTFERLHNWTSDAANGININAGEMDAEDNGFAAGLTLCVTRDGQGKMAADFTPATTGEYNLGTAELAWLSINGIPIEQVTGGTYYAQTAAEAAASVTPVNYQYYPGDVRRYGAAGDGVTDDYLAFNKASSCNVVVLIPPLTFYLSTAITVPSGVIFAGGGMLPGEASYTGTAGTVLSFANGVATCVTLSGGNLGTCGIRDLTVTRAGTPASSSIGILVYEGANIVLENVRSTNHGYLFALQAYESAGISCKMINCWGDAAVTDYFHIDSWPELYVFGGRFGSGADYSGARAFVYVTGTSPSSGGIGPNTLRFTGVHFNGKSGTNGPSYFWEMDNVGTPSGNQVEYVLDNCHIEAVSTAVIYTTATAPYLNRITITGGTLFNCTSATFWSINAATAISELEINNARIYCSAFSLTGGSQVDKLSIIGGEILGAATINGPSGFGNNAQIVGTTFVNGLTFTGLWASLYALVQAASITNSADQYTSGSYIEVRNGSGGYSSRTIATEGITVAGTANGYLQNTYTARGTYGTPTVSTANDIALRLQSYCYTGAAYGRIALMRHQVSGTPSAGSTAGVILLSATPSGSTSPTDIAEVNSGAFSPVSDNAYTCGQSGLRWSAVWAANGSIQTSDVRAKTDVAQSVLGLDFINALQPVSYRWISGGTKVVRQVWVNEDGSEVPEGEDPGPSAAPGRIITQAVPGKRTHFGLIAQQVKAVLPPGVDFGGWVQDDVTDPNSAQSLRYDQFVAPLIKSVQELTAIVRGLTARLDRIEGKA